MIVPYKMLREGYQLPRWYGVAYFRPEMRQQVCYPIPFHWLVRWARQAWWAFLVPKKRLAEEQKWDSMLAEEFTNGYNQGREAERAHLIRRASALGLGVLPMGYLDK